MNTDDLYKGLKNVISVQELTLKAVSEINEAQQGNDKRVETLKNTVVTLVDQIKILKETAAKLSNEIKILMNDN